MHHTVAFVEFVPVVDLGIAAGAALAIMALLALYLILGAVEAFFQHMPWPLSTVAGFAASAMRWARDSVAWVFDQALHGLTWSVKALVRFWEDLYNTIREVTYDLEHASRVIKHHDIPRLNRQLRDRINQANRYTRNWTANLVAAVRLQLQREINRIWHDLSADVKRLNQRITSVDKSLSHRLTALGASLRAEISRVQHSLNARISDVSQRLTAMIVTRFDAAEALARSLFHTAEQDITQAKTDAEAYTDRVATRLHDDVIAQVDREAHRGWEDSFGTVTAMIGTLEKVAADDFPELTRLLKEFPSNVPLDLTAAIAASARFMPPVLRTMIDCEIPNCRDLGPTRQILHDMQLPITSLALIAWFIQMVTHPEAWADETYTVLNPLINAEYDILSGFLGL